MNIHDPDLWLRLNRATTFEAIGEGVLHDLRNPLQGITMAARTVADAPADSAMVARLAPLVVKASEKLEKALDRLALAHVRARDKQAEPTAVQTAIAAAVTVYRGLSKRQGPSIADDLPTDMPAVLAVEPYLRHAVLNLVLNAGESLEQQADGEISVKAERSGDRVVITIDDNGPGVPNVDRERVLEPFFTTRAESGHLGLGLAVVRHVVNLWGGSLELGQSSMGGLRAAVSLRAVLGARQLE